MTIKTWIVLLRGINDGGNNLLPMKELRTHLGHLGLQNIQTYIQSGNCIFDRDRSDHLTLATTIAESINGKCGFRREVMVITRAELDAAIMNNPHLQGDRDPKSVHLFFLPKPAQNPSLERLQQLRRPNEAFALSERVFYRYAPGGVGRSELAAQVENCLAVPVTGRNFKSARKIAEIANE